MLCVVLALSVASSPISAGCVSCSLLAADPPAEELTPPPLPPESPPDGTPVERGPLIHRDGEVGPLDDAPEPEEKPLKPAKKLLTQDPHINSFSLREIGFAGLATLYMDLNLPLVWWIGFTAFELITTIPIGWQGWAAVHGIATIVSSAVLQWRVADAPTENGALLPVLGQVIGAAVQLAFFILAGTTPALVVPFLLAGLFTRYVVTPFISSVLLHRRFSDKPIEPDPPGVEVFRF